jgi:DNA-binding response OmpR family regulator
VNGRRPRILLVEDEWLIAETMATTLRADGFEIVGPMWSAEPACRSIRESAPDAAILDIALGDNETSYPIARCLAEHGVPFAFMSGYSQLQIPAEFRDVPLVSKPISLSALAGMVGELLRR